jgi:hypothetical protein
MRRCSPHPYAPRGRGEAAGRVGAPRIAASASSGAAVAPRAAVAGEVQREKRGEGQRGKRVEGRGGAPRMAGKPITTFSYYDPAVMPIEPITAISRR